MRISDWSSDVCSSDLGTDHSLPLAILAIAALFGGWIHIPLDSVLPQAAISEAAEHAEHTLALTSVLVSLFGLLCAWFFFLKNRTVAAAIQHSTLKIGKGSCRERVCQYVLISGDPVPLQKK